MTGMTMIYFYSVVKSVHVYLLWHKAPNEIGNHRQILQYVANYRNELRLFTHEVRMLITSEIPDHVVVFPKKIT